MAYAASMKSFKKYLRKTKTLNRYTAPPALLFVILVVILLAQGFAGYRLLHRMDALEQQVKTQANQNSGQDFQVLAKEAAELAYLPVVVNAQDMFVYMPELKIRTPLTEESRRLTYTPGEDGTSGAISHAYAYVTLNNQGTFDKFECGRISEFTFAPSEDAAKSRTLQTVQLADGRTLYLYTLDKDYCDSFISKILVADIMAILAQAQSY